MALQDQLEIIRTNGEIEFYNLAPDKGVTNIGSHPENDIIIDSSGAAPFHAMLDHRQKPYQLVVLSQDGQTRVGGRTMPANVSTALQNWDAIEIDGHTIILVETTGAGSSAGSFVLPAAAPTGRPSPANGGVTSPGVSTPPLSRPASIAPPTTRPESIQPSGGPAFPGSTTLPALTGYRTRPPDREDEYIVTELSTQEATIEVDQTGSYQLTIINGGDIVAAFRVRVEGVNPAWIEISQPMVNLNEGARATVIITITPPRRPTSRAGPHHLAFIVTSANYPGRASQRGATLTINPYYEFAVGEMSPRQQKLSWFKRSGHVLLPVVNKSNTGALFQVDGADDERALSFEFQVPGEAVNLARQAELNLQSSETVSIPVEITPHSRPLIGLRRRSHAFTLTTMMLGGQQTPRSILGQLRQSPLLGPLHLLVLVLLLTFLIVIIFRPYIRTFNVDGSARKVITAGQSVTLNWNASAFARLTIPELGPAPLDSPSGKVTAVPTANVSYELRADNWLSRLSPRLFAVDPRTVSVVLTPVPPNIQIFDGDKRDILAGGSVDLSWLVKNAETVMLVNQSDGNVKPLSGTSGTIGTGPLDRDTTYVLEASNPYIATPVRSDPFTVRVSTPTPTPPPTPAVVRFFANPPVIVAGESTTLEWAVEGTDQVAVLGVGAGLPAVQTISQSPQQTTNYVLNAANGPAAARPQSVTVYVTPAPSATPMPDAPEIVFFTADSEELIQGKADAEEDEKQVSLSWLIKGDVTNVELNGGPDVGVFSNLDSPEGTFTTTLDKNTVFVLTAFNEDKTSSKTTQVEVLEATPTTTPEPSATPAPTATATPTPPIIYFFKVEAQDSADAARVESLGDDKYRVEAGANIRLSWQVSADATEVILSPGNSSFGPGSNFFDVASYSASDPDQYDLIARNSASSQPGSKSVFIEVVAQSAPDPPSSVDGHVPAGATDNVITWIWSGSQSIAGFKIYRSDVPPGNNFTGVQTVGSDPPFEWTDSGAGCGKIYHVVTLYYDANLNIRETSASGTSWSSPACP